MLYDIKSVDLENIIIYLRKSRSDDPSMSVEEVLASHERQLQEYSKTMFGEKIPEEHIFRDVVSGETIADRPVMKEIMKLLETGMVKAVLVIEPQRLSRGDLEDCGRIVNTFRYTNTLIVTPPKTYNLSDEYDRKFFEMELTRGNDYLEYTKKILNRGRYASVKQGNFIGSIAPYGYKKVKNVSSHSKSYTLEIIPEEADAVKMMYHLYVDEGFGFARIARQLDELGIKPRHASHWSSSALKDMIENPVYIGKIRWNWRKTEKIMVDGQIVKTRPKTKDPSQWIYVDGKHEPIIDEETYNKAIGKRRINVSVRKSKEIVNPFAGLLFCGKCGKAMSYKRTYNRKKDGSKAYCLSILCNDQAVCKTKSVKYDALEDRVIQVLKDSIADFELKLENDDGNAHKIQMDLIQDLQNTITNLKQKDARQKDAYEDGIYTKQEYAVRNAKVQEEIAEAKKALANAQNTLPPSVDYNEKIIKFTDCLNAFQSPDVSPREKNNLLKACVSKILYYNDGVSKVGIGRHVENKFNIEVTLRL